GPRPRRPAAAPPRCITNDNARCGPGTPGGRAGTVSRRPDTRQDGEPDWQFATPDQVGRELRSAGYLPDERISSVVYLGDRLRQTVRAPGAAGRAATQR